MRLRLTRGGSRGKFGEKVEEVQGWGDIKKTGKTPSLKYLSLSLSHFQMRHTDEYPLPSYIHDEATRRPPAQLVGTCKRARYALCLKRSLSATLLQQEKEMSSGHLRQITAERPAGMGERGIRRVVSGTGTRTRRVRSELYMEW